ncbi:AraC-like DNA-binding protein/mannose-6-phosphate isomerase-like protein (cupin superfamily) [Paenibacillus harenae]|uniref:AraC-like DNA-binding protein/mannose-6-phosphate isomerase-like protein (Cupin superfamily) n=1 Tax=Paenibacillus harenae TaxID=306543 RepID=A0ABT9TUM9_PAEHA|nr:AraC-like DNA-binding protein/mannose-6-phosphate isomerase-like protein (cupin superfamily) [Paenibacillus harenae]
MPSFPYEMMREREDALERLELHIRWGRYDIHVLRFHLTHFPAGRIIGFHKHAEYEFHFIPQGRGKVIIIDQEYALKAGLFYLTGPEVMHYQEADKIEPMDELCLHVDIIDRSLERSEPDDVYDDWEDAEAQACVEKLKTLPAFPTSDLHEAMPCFLDAYRAYKDNFTGSYTTIKQNVIQILLRAVRAYETASEQKQFPTRDMKAYRYRLAMEYIHANYAGSITLEDVADKLNLGVRQIQRLFKELHNGQSFSRILEDIRLAAVCRELANTELSVEQIAKNAGFAAGNYLHSVFRKRYGMTPSDYRKKGRQTVTTLKTPF